MMSTIIFYILSVFTLLSAIAAVTATKIFRAAIYLLFTLMGVAGIYFWLNYEFIAAVQIIVYVGGVVVLIIFSIFLTERTGEDLPKQNMVRKLAGALAVLFGIALVLFQIMPYKFPQNQVPGTDQSIHSIGVQLLNMDQTGYALPFELVSLLLLAALVGCIVIAMQEPETDETNKII